jgi:hypothetical protein
MIYKTEILVQYNFGGRSLVYSKTFDLPFVPFIGLEIIFDDKKGYEIILENNDSCTTIISYNLEKNQFEVTVRTWKHLVDEETIDLIVEKYTNWKKMHSINVDELKKYMNRKINEKNII